MFELVRYEYQNNVIVAVEKTAFDQKKPALKAARVLRKECRFASVYDATGMPVYR